MQNRKASMTQEKDRDSSLANKSHMPKGSHTRNNSSALRQTGSNTLDVKGYRGNLYKQTLSPSWSKRRLKEAQKKYEKIDTDARASMDGNSALSSVRKGTNVSPPMDASKREAYLDTRMSNNSSWLQNPTGAEQYFAGTNKDMYDTSSSRLFTKTVTNFSQVRYDNNGGLNPVSPVKRGLALNVTA